MANPFDRSAIEPFGADRRAACRVGRRKDEGSRSVASTFLLMQRTHNLILALRESEAYVEGRKIQMQRTEPPAQTRQGSSG
jgi:hypothetical protein